ncbi:MAG: hypothetical protein AAF483_25170 [Planctomycetota bacterium]
MNLALFRERLAAGTPNCDLTLIDDASIAALSRDYPQLPAEYFDLLRLVGHGAFADCTYAIYSGPVHPADIYGDDRAAALDRIDLIGDDFCGYCLGYLDGTLGEVSGCGEWQPLADSSLVSFLAGRLFDYEP